MIAKYIPLAKKARNELIIRGSASGEYSDAWGGCCRIQHNSYGLWSAFTDESLQNIAVNNRLLQFETICIFLIAF
jgi:hypothetical protein